MPTIKTLTGYEILDSRGRPTVLAVCQLVSGAKGAASVPSGASTGSSEALELRDGDPTRYRGLGCRKAAGHVSGVIQDALAHRTFDSHSTLDRALIELDGTPNKARLGANAILAVSLAFARAAAVEQDMPLYRYFGALLSETPHALPLPTINLFSGGKHAGGQVAIQDVLVVPVAAHTMDEALSMAFAVYQAAADLVFRKYRMRPLTADEGGLAPAFDSPVAMLEDAVEAIHAAGFQPGADIALAVDVASTHFYRDGRYHLGGESLDSQGMITHLLGWLERYPIISIEDGLAEDDWDYWPELRAQAGEGVQILGDDLLCTNPSRIRRAVDQQAANALLLKVNQIGTLSEAAEACALAKASGWRIVVSARSGETEDDWLADLAVGWSADHIKVGSITQSERLAKYNRLLLLEAQTGFMMKRVKNTKSKSS
jgi:enolase